MRLPVPPEFRKARADLYETLVTWLYSLHHPIDVAIAVPRYEEDEDDFDWDMPIDVDVVFTDEAIMQRLVDEVRNQVRSYQKNCKYLVSTYAWAALAGPLL